MRDWIFFNSKSTFSLHQLCVLHNNIKHINWTNRILDVVVTQPQSQPIPSLFDLALTPTSSVASSSHVCSPLLLTPLLLSSSYYSLIMTNLATLCSSTLRPDRPPFLLFITHWNTLFSYWERAQLAWCLPPLLLPSMAWQCCKRRQSRLEIIVHPRPLPIHIRTIAGRPTQDPATTWPSHPRRMNHLWM